MRILLWIGNEPNQKALANKIAAEFNVVGIVTESRISRRKLTLRKVLNSVYERTFLSEINRSVYNSFHSQYSTFLYRQDCHRRHRYSYNYIRCIFL